ncbi:hypothetical protein FAM09_05665 [Niastella caeni]|uniref:Transporter n=1 Tax=Niastella caeni TaxID=2569763 RepID=A0A4S8I3I5_9BACT|nr:hypothetical protein [Niastella caeni]THU41584.1 hypothetical protein FAM09_05665 [Niastella caeni]
MTQCWKACLQYSILLLLLTAGMFTATAQTEFDAIMMKKNNFCAGGMYGYSSWKNYWEGTLKRENLNLGTVSTQMVAFMGNYGLSDKLNILFGVPYVTTKASAGTLHGQNGIQDGSLWLKWMPYEKTIGKGDLSLYAIAGVSAPLSNYVADFLPVSIGLRSKTLSLRAMGDYQVGKFYVTASGTYMFRSNIKIDRDAYYTTEMHYTNEVEMPDVLTFNVRTGYRYKNLIADAFVDNQTTLGGFDITRNNMPFPSNEMNATRLGIYVKYELNAIRGLSLIGTGNYVVAGRNMGQATTISGGLFYILDFNKKKSTSATPKKQTP